MHSALRHMRSYFDLNVIHTFAGATINLACQDMRQFEFLRLTIAQADLSRYFLQAPLSQNTRFRFTTES